MDANNQDKTENKTPVAEDKPSSPPSLPANQAKKAPLQRDYKKTKQTLKLFGTRAAFIGIIVLIFISFVFGWSLWIIISLLLIGIVLLVLLISVRQALQWTGFRGYEKVTKEYSPDEKLAKITKEQQPSKTLWDWLQLLGVLAIPIAVTIFGAGFSSTIAQQQTLVTLQISREQEQETALQQYLDSMSTLLVNKDIQDPIKGAQLRQVARARTVVVLTTLTGSRKGTILQFLLQSNLINITNPIVDLRRLNLEGISLRGANLTKLNLSQADLGEADLSGSFLTNTDLSGSFLVGTNLIGADLAEANLSNTNLSGANLNEAILAYANLKGALVSPDQLSKAKSLKGATMPDGSIHP